MHDGGSLWLKYILRGTIGLVIQSSNGKNKQAEWTKKQHLTHWGLVVNIYVNELDNDLFR